MAAILKNAIHQQTRWYQPRPTATAESNFHRQSRERTSVVQARLGRWIETWWWRRRVGFKRKLLLRTNSWPFGAVCGDDQDAKQENGRSHVDLMATVAPRAHNRLCRRCLVVLASCLLDAVEGSHRHFHPPLQTLATNPPPHTKESTQSQSLEFVIKYSTISCVCLLVVHFKLFDGGLNWHQLRRLVWYVW